MAKKIIKTLEEITRARIESGIADMELKLKDGIIPLKPTRFFEINEQVRFGAHNEVYVREIYADGLFYTIECIDVKRSRDLPPANEAHVIEWHELYKTKPLIPTTFKKEEKYRITISNSSIDSLLSMVYHSGVDFDVDYQREHVWKYAEKISLLDSIFNNIDIGKFVFVQRSMGHRGKLYEIIDGKQRLTTLCEFYEDRFPYNGYFFSEISGNDRGKFLHFGIAYGYLENPTREAILESFIKLNTCGKPMSTEHLDHVKALLKEMEGDTNG